MLKTGGEITFREDVTLKHIKDGNLNDKLLTLISTLYPNFGKDGVNDRDVLNLSITAKLQRCYPAENVEDIEVVVKMLDDALGQHLEKKKKYLEQLPNKIKKLRKLKAKRDEEERQENAITHAELQNALKTHLNKKEELSREYQKKKQMFENNKQSKKKSNSVANLDDSGLIQSQKNINQAETVNTELEMALESHLEKKKKFSKLKHKKTTEDNTQIEEVDNNIVENENGFFNKPKIESVNDATGENMKSKKLKRTSESLEITNIIPEDASVKSKRPKVKLEVNADDAISTSVKQKKNKAKTKQEVNIYDESVLTAEILHSDNQISKKKKKNKTKKNANSETEVSTKPKKKSKKTDTILIT